MKFIVDAAVFDVLPAAVFGVVVAKGADNTQPRPEVDAMLDNAVALAEQRFAGKRVKEEPAIIPYREAFQALGINPNKYSCSVEALFTRISKGKGMPRINPLVDLSNAVSLANTLPMGTHDLASCDDHVQVRFARPGDSFIPFGETQGEAPEDGELVYAVGSQVRTRRWTWRQSEAGKITPSTSYVFFPIDGFHGINDDAVDKAAKELEAALERIFACKTARGLVDKAHPEMNLAL